MYVNSKQKGKYCTSSCFPSVTKKNVDYRAEEVNNPLPSSLVQSSDSNQHDWIVSHVLPTQLARGNAYTCEAQVL